MTIGQLCFYDQIKQTLLASGLFGDNLVTHFTSSLGAVEMLFFFLEYKNPVFKMAQQLFPGCHRHHDDPAAWCAQNAVNERKARFFLVVFI